MQIQTFSIIAGTAICNARCPFCISRMTPPNGVTPKAPPLIIPRFQQACRFAKNAGVSTVLLTGKGEPTLYKDQIEGYLTHLAPFGFGITEIQTNGARLWEAGEEYVDTLRHWVELGLTTVAISIVSADPEANRRIYFPNRDSYYNLPGLISLLHDLHITVRLSVTMTADTMKSMDDFISVVDFAKTHGVEQLTFRPVNKPDDVLEPEVGKWTEENFFRPELYSEIQTHLVTSGALLLNLMHGAAIYDLGGQNVCLTNCLTRSTDPNEIRQIIYFPDGHLRYDWALPGAILF